MTDRDQPASEKPNLDWNDFHHRWRKARMSAIRKTGDSLKSFESDAEEDLLIQLFSEISEKSEAEKEEKRNSLLRNIFDHSRHLAISLSKHLGLTFEIEDFRDLLVQSEILCFHGAWQSRSAAQVLTRPGCDFCPQLESEACNYWREAVDGLVMGLGNHERFARHSSLRHGDATCVDVLFCESGRVSGQGLAWGALPEHMSSTLNEICQDFELKMKAPVQLKGLNEGILYFEFKELSKDQMCGGGKLLSEAFKRKVQNFYPGLGVQEVSARAVMGESGA